ncbi:helix-turn-helix domain-containing protein [Anaerotignum sp.]
MGIGARIKEILKQKNKTILWLAEKSGVPKNTLYTITKRDNTNIRHENLKKIAAALEVSVEDLLEPEESNNIKNNGQKTNDMTTLFVGRSSTEVFKKIAEEIINSEKFNKEISAILAEKFAEHDPIFKSEQLNETTMELYATSSARDILEPYSKLNDSGKEKAVELVSELTKKKHYQRDYTTDLAQMEKYQKKEDN